MGKRRIPRYQRDAEPTGRIPADPSKQAPNNSYSPLEFYEDTPFVCVDCGKEEIWTAKQQQWWYEVAKGSIYSRATRCRTCRRARRARRKTGPGDQPIRHTGTLMKLIRAEVEPAIARAGFILEAQHKSWRPCERAWIDYRKQDQLLSLAFERSPEGVPRLIAELLDEKGDCRTVVVTEFNNPRTRREVEATIKEFASALTQFAASVA